jgi:HK97 family phage portal protein
MDNFLTRWARSRREQTLTPGVPSTTDPGAAENQQPKGANWESNVVHPYGRRSLLVPAWYRGVTLLMQTMGQMVTQWQKMNGEGGNYIEDRYGIGRRINYLLQIRPNPLMTASQMQEQVVYRQIYWGNAYIYIERNEYGDPHYLWLCTGGGYDPITNTYSLTYNREHGPEVLMSVPAQDVIHFKNVIMTDSMYMGVPVIDFAYKALCIAATADEQALQDVAKGGKHKVLIQEQKSQSGQMGILGRTNQNELRKATRQFAEDWQANDVVMLDNVADAKVISQTAQQLQLLEQRGFEVTDLARILGIPRLMMMEEAGSAYKMPEHATQEFLLRTIQPRIREWEDELNSKLLREEDFGRRRIHVCELALRRLDAKGQAEIDKMHMETGWSVNEIRSQYDLPNIEGGDLHYVSTNLAELGSEKLRAPGAPAPAAPKASQGEEGVEE